VTADEHHDQHERGSASATSFTQYWNACTTVIERIPPPNAFTVTSTITNTMPTHGGTGMIVDSVSPAPCNCGTRYSTLITTTNTVHSRRNAVEPSRASAKSGNV